MDNRFKEKHKLPLTFKYLEFFRKKDTEDRDARTTYFISCEKYQTDFYVRSTPVKALTRML